MSASSYGIITEGIYDSAVYEAIIKKLSPGIPIKALECGGRFGLMKKFPGLLKVFEYQLAEGPVEMAVVTQDADGKNPEEIEVQMASRIAGREYPFALGVRFFAVSQALESWLLADVNALNAVSLRRRGKRVTKSHDAPEALFRPKEDLRRLLSDHKLDYTSELAREIAQEIDLNKLSEACPRFRVFSRLVDC
jgi:hypothetical protein